MKKNTFRQTDIQTFIENLWDSTYISDRPRRARRHQAARIDGPAPQSRGLPGHARSGAGCAVNCRVVIGLRGSSPLSIP